MLESLDADLLRANRCYFGGGTAIALRYGEYRESLDVDLLVSSREGYRALRERVTRGEGVQALARRGARLHAPGEVRADQYGIRTRIDAVGVPIKLEIVHEGRIDLDEPGAVDNLCGVATLTPLDLAATKLLANSDRWADDAVQSRDVIDLAMMAPPKALLARAMRKAKAAYGDSVERDLVSAITRLKERRDRLESCMEALRMTVPKALLWQRLRALLPSRRPSA